MNNAERLLLTNVSVVVADRVVEKGAVVVESGLIEFVGTGVPAGEKTVLDLSGMILLPGFVDVHIHGAVGVDVMDATPEELAAVSGYLASQGVTSWLPTLVPASDDNYATAIGAISEAAKHSTGARIVGVHYEGPFVNTKQCGALHTEYFKTYSSPEDLDFLIVPENGTQMITLAPEVSGGVALVRELKKRGWVISIGHTRADLKLLDDACDAGARHMTHFMNAMSPLHHRTPGPIAWGLSREDVTFDLIADGIHLDPFMLRLLLKLKGARGITLISDAIAAAGKGDGDYQLWGETIAVKNGRTANAAGSIAGSVISLQDAVQLLHSLGVSFLDLARMASSNPAQLLGLEDRGTIGVGKRADLVAVDQSGAVRLTLIGGEVAHRS